MDLKALRSNLVRELPPLVFPEPPAPVRFAPAEVAGWSLVVTLAVLAALLFAGGMPGLHHAVYELAEGALLLQ